MKNKLIWLLLLLSTVSYAQTVTRAIAELNPAPGKTGSKYYVYYDRDWNLYPATATGLKSLTIAIASGNLSLTTTVGGCVIAKGIRPPGTAPTCGTTPPVTTPVTAYFANGFGEGSVAQLMQSAPFVPTTNQYSSWPTGNTTQYLDNGVIRFGIGKAVGGAVKWMGLSGSTENWINTSIYGSITQFEGVDAPDPGRSLGWSMYGTPGMNYLEANADLATWFNTGYNPVHGGSVFGDHSQITWFERRTVNGVEVMYCRTTPYQWALRSVLSKTTYHCWWWLDGHNVRNYSIIDNARDDTQMSNQGRQQEGPFAYTIAPLWHHKLYSGSSPYSNGGLLDISSPEPVAGSSTQGQYFSDLKVGTENWIASVNDSDNGVIIQAPFNSRFHGGQFVGRGGNEFSNESSYINSAMMLNYDVKSTMAFAPSFWVGNLSEFRQWVNANPIQSRPFSFSFGQHNHCGWWTADTPAKWNGDDRYEFTFGKSDGSGGNFCPPYGVYRASDMPTLYIKGKFSGGISQIDIRWNRYDQDDNQSNQAGQVATLNVIGDGIERTYSINPGWTGIIGSMRIAPHLGNTTSESQKFVPTYIGKVNPNAASDWQTAIALSILAGGMARRRRKKLDVRSNQPTRTKNQPELTR